MARNENPPFGRGETYYQGRTIDSNDLGGTHLEGMEWEFEDLDYSVQGVKTPRSGKRVRCRLVRNASGIALLPKRAVIYQETAGNFLKRVDGYGNITADMIAGIVDEWLPSAGVSANDLFWIVVEGPTNCLTDLAGADNNVIGIADHIIALTAATSQATTAGRVYSWNAALTFTSTQTTDGTLGKVLHNIIGQSLSAKTTANTNASVLVDLKKRW